KKRAVSHEAGSPSGSASARKKKKAPAGAGESVSLKVRKPASPKQKKAAAGDTTPSKGSKGGGSGNSGSPSVGPVPGGVSGSSIYCVCHSSDEGFMVECSDGTGGCGGWFHPECCNLELSPEQRQKNALKKFKFVCSLCVKGDVQVVAGTPRKKKAKPKAAAAAGATEGASPKTKAAKKTGVKGSVGGRPAAAATGAPSPAGMPPPSPKPTLKRRRSQGGAKGGQEGGAGGKPRKPKPKRPRSSAPSPSSSAAAEQLAKRAGAEGSDEDDSWGEESVDEDGRGEKGARATAYSTRDRKDRVKYAGTGNPDVSDDYLTDDGEAEGGQPSSKRGSAAMAAANAIASLADPSGRGSPSSLSSLGGHGRKRHDLVRKEMYLVKWKNLSYLHNSWEMATHLMDPRNPSNRQKLLRYNNKMEQEHGPDWRKVMEDLDAEEGAGEKEYFPSDMAEVQRIITCETTTTLHEAVLRRERHDMLCGDLDPSSQVRQTRTAAHRPQPGCRVCVLPLLPWRGLPYDQSSWEHFKDIRFASDQILDFWDFCRLSPKDMAEVDAQLSQGGKGNGGGVRGGGEALKGHNLRVRDFTKMVTSPVFGVTAAEKAAKADGGAQAEEGEGAAAAAAPAGAGGLTLRDYQLEGVNWLLWNWWNHRSSILADEMGLGKTIQTVGFLDQLWNNKLTKIRGPFCVVAPLSLVAQWQSEKLRSAGRVKFHILITTYEVALKDVRELSRIHWKVLVVDEAHRLKNCGSKLVHVFCLFDFHGEAIRSGVNQQRVNEAFLWALLNFADGHEFFDQKGFKDQFGDLKGSLPSNVVAKLHEMLRPYLLRRVKEDVEKSLPPKASTCGASSLTPVQRQFYRAIYEKNTQFLFKGARPCCNHPFLNRGVEERILSEIPDELQTRANIHKQLVDASGKMVLLAKLLPRLLAEGHKVLIFSQMVRCLDLIE
ncbi:unnamed protein product, partial [Scytosiphon promiscuus]